MFNRFNQCFGIRTPQHHSLAPGKLGLFFIPSPGHHRLSPRLVLNTSQRIATKIVSTRNAIPSITFPPTKSCQSSSHGTRPRQTQRQSNVIMPPPRAESSLYLRPRIIFMVRLHSVITISLWYGFCPRCYGAVTVPHYLSSLHVVLEQHLAHKHT